MAAAWHEWGNGLMWVGGIIIALEALRRAVRWTAGRVHKVINWFKDKQAEDRETAKVIGEMQAFLTTNNGGSTMLDQVQSINRKLDNHGDRLVLIEDYITNPPKGHHT